jgi:ribosomal protein S18 acetylase RimI-like enzyme
MICLFTASCVKPKSGFPISQSPNFPIAFQCNIFYTLRMIEIRPYKSRDRDAVVTICHRTGYFGEDAGPYFKDAGLFGLLFTVYYLDYEPEHCFVADDSGRAVGYIIGSTDTVAQREAFDRLVVPRIVKRAFTKTLFCHPGDVWFLLGLTNHAEYEKGLYSEDLVTKFPAHLHMNVLPGYQRQGLGGRLMAQFLDSMRATGAPGVHLVTSTENKKALPFYKREGFAVFKELPTKLWEKKSPPTVRTLVFVRSLR